MSLCRSCGEELESKHRYCFSCGKATESAVADTNSMRSGVLSLSNPSSDFVYIPAGSFTMGRTTGSGDEDELPTHMVNLSGYYVSKYQVTTKEWRTLMGSNPTSVSGNLGNNYPVNSVSWYDAILFCNKRSISEGITPAYSVNGDTNIENWGKDFCPILDLKAEGYRLLTEAEWEYAARGASSKDDFLYSGSNFIDVVAWYDTGYGSQFHAVAIKKANSLGLFDMSGNVWEWCWDFYGKYSSGVQINPTGIESSFSRIVRGGSSNNSESVCRISNRGSVNASYSNNDIGFRLARTAKQ